MKGAYDEGAWITAIMLAIGCVFLMVQFGLFVGFGVLFVVGAIAGEIQRKTNQIMDRME